MKKANYKWMVYNTGFSIAHDFDGPTLYVCNCINIYPFKNTYTNSIKLSLDAFETIPPPLFLRGTTQIHLTIAVSPSILGDSSWTDPSVTPSGLLIYGSSMTRA